MVGRRRRHRRPRLPIDLTPGYVAPNEPPVADDSVTFTMAEDGTLLISEGGSSWFIE